MENIVSNRCGFLMHSSLKSDICNFPKISKRFYSSNRNIRSSKNHYDTLQIRPNATHNEIKSAYYKLTFQYHPDKNKSEHAKQKFHDISEAYEVLSNHEQRKSYDQYMKIRQPSVSTTIKTSTEARQRIYKTTKMYNYDAWIQAHYGRQLNLTQELLRNREQMKRNKHSYKDIHNLTLVQISTFVIIFFLMTVCCKPNVDDTSYLKKIK